MFKECYKNVYIPEKYVYNDPKMIKKGTTTLVLKHNEGFVVAVDSRATMDSYIADSRANKAIKITDHMIGTIAGALCDCHHWLKKLEVRAKKYFYENNKIMPVSEASLYLADELLFNKVDGISIGTFLVGADYEGVSAYEVNNTGARYKVEGYSSVGSGSTFALSTLTEHFHGNMGVLEAIDVGKKAIYNATHRDAYSGNSVTVYNVKNDQTIDFIGKWDVEELRDLYGKVSDSN